MNVMITGAAGGLGRAIAVECGSRGYDLFLTDIAPNGLESIELGIKRQFGVNVITHACDLTHASAVDIMLADIDRMGLAFDMLINVAGIDFEGGFLTQDREASVKIISLNDAATLRITHAMLGRRNKVRFTVVFVSSLASMFPMPLKAEYAASKPFLLDFATALRQELKADSVNVLTLCPAGMETTPKATKKIAAQGFWGDVTTNALESVARRTVDRALRGRTLYVPGVFNRLLAGLGRLVPRSLAAAVVYRRRSDAQRRWMNTEE